MRILIFIAILYPAGSIYAQWKIPDSIRYRGITGIFLDTSSYIPSSWSGALDYNLMIAASKGYTSEIERLIGKGADIDAETNERASALVFAVTNNRIEAVKTLIKYNPQLNNLTKSDETPLLIAVKNRNFEITEVLIRAGAEVDFPDRRGARPLHYAAIYGYLETVDMLLYYDASIEVRSEEGTTPLLASIRAGYPDITDLLIQRGANLEAKDYEGYTPILMATYFADTLMIKLLHKKGADIYAINNSGHDALDLSIISGQSEVTLLLLRIGAKWTDSGRNAINPYRVASKYRRKDILSILEKNNVGGKFNYEIDQIDITASSRFSINDIYTGLCLSFKEPFLNAGFVAGCDTKLWYTRILIKESDHLFYQYMDKGSVAYAGFFKDFELTDHPDRFNYSFSTSLLAGYSFGNKLKGTLIAPVNKFKIIPAISFKITKWNISLTAGLEYIKTEYYHTGPVWFRTGCSYNYFLDNVRTKIKPLKWY